MFAKKISAIILIFIMILQCSFVASAETTSAELTGSVGASNTFLVATSDKYLFAATGESAQTTYTISVYDKESLQLLTNITQLSSDGEGGFYDGIYLRVYSMHIKGDYLYVSYTPGKKGGNPTMCKYDIKEIYSNRVMEPIKRVGMRPYGYSYMNDDILCRTDSGYGNIAFMNLENLTDISGIGVSSYNLDTLKAYKGLHLEGDVLYAYTTNSVYIYDASYALKGVSKQDSYVLKGSFSLLGTINNIKGFGDTLYVATSNGVYIIDTSSAKTTGVVNNLGLLPEVGSTKALNINNGNMYLSSFGELKIFNLDTPTEPTLVYSIMLQNGNYNYIHLRPGKIYGGSARGVDVYDISGIEIDETLTSGNKEVSGNITYKQTLSEFEGVSKICGGENYLFALTDSNIINVINSRTLEKITEVYKEKDGIKLTVSDMSVKDGWLYVSYSGALRKYKISQITEGILPKEEAVVPMFSDMSKDTATHIAETDKYIFVAVGVSSRDYQSDSNILVYSKETSEYLTSIWVDTGGERDLPVRNMWTYEDTLYVSWNNVKSNKSYVSSTSGNINLSRYHSPLISYDVTSITKDMNLTPTVINKNNELKNLTHPYNRGGNSYLDEENGVLYQGVYTLDDGQCYKAINIKAGESDLIAEWKNGSMDCVRFFVKDGYLFEVLDNNAGLILSGSITQEFNKVVVYDIKDGENASDYDLSKRICGTYTTSIYGNSTINDVVADSESIYLATTSGVEIVDRNSMIKSDSISDVGTVYSIKLEDSLMFLATSKGIYIYDISEETELIAQYAESARALAVDKEEKKIYIASKRAEGYAKVLSYDILEGSITLDRGVILEDLKCHNATVSDAYVMANLDDIEEKITVYDRETGLMTVEITTDTENPSNLMIHGKYFYTYDANKLSVYKIPSASSDLASCLVANYETSDEITCFSVMDNSLYLATKSGIYVLDVSSVSSGLLRFITTIAENREIGAVCVNGKNLYATQKTNNQISVYNTSDYTETTSADIESSENITKITVAGNKCFCLSENGDILCYEVDNGIAVNYNPVIYEPEEKMLSEVVNEKGFPYAEFKEKVHSTHKYVTATGKYVITSGTGNIKIFDKNLDEISAIDVESAEKPYVFGDTMVSLVSSDGYKVMAYDLSSIDIEIKETEITALSDGGFVYSGSDRIVVYDKSSYNIKVFSHDGALIGTVTDCPEDATKIYYKDGFIYLISKTTINLYDISNLEELKETSSTDISRATFTIAISYGLTAIEAVDDYLYVAANKGTNGNRMYVFDLTKAKAGEETNPEIKYRYSTISANQGGNISHFTRCGDFLVLNAQDAKELQIINIKTRLKPYRESFVLKTEENSDSYEDISVSDDKIYAISSSGGISVYDYHAVDIADIEFVSEGKTTTVETGKSLSAKVSIYNESASVVNANLILAVYEGKRLINLSCADIVVASGGETIRKTIELNIESYEDVSIKAFLIDSETYTPLSECSQVLKANGSGQMTIYVDANADAEKADGSENYPFKTIEEAKEKVKTLNKQMTGDITVEIAGGRYELSQPLIFDENDGGFNGFNVIYKAKDGETPIISGGKKIEGWSLYDEEKGIYSASASGVFTRQLVVNGENAIRARSDGGLTHAECDEGELGIYCYDDFIADYKNIKDLELVFCGKFLSRRVGVDGAYKLDSSGRTLLALNRPFWQTTTDFSSYILPSYYENAYELLDKENEFYLDRKENVIYYKPKEGVNIEEAEIIAPVLEELFVLKGSDYYKKVKNVEFKGLEFTDTTWLRPSLEGGFYPKQAGYYGVPNKFSVDVFSSIFEAAISMSNAENISISSCRIENVGGNGIRIIEAASNIEITGNKIEDISAGGIYIGEVNWSDANPYDIRRRISDIKINNNYVNNIATEYYSSCALALGTGQNVEITHNEFANTPYSAVHISWGWDSSYKRNITGLNLSQNYIHDAVSLLGDGGAIYTTGYTLADSELNPNLISKNFIERVNGRILFAGAAIYLDTGSSGYLVSENVIDLCENNSAWIPRWGNGNSANRFENNFVSTENGVTTSVGTTVVTDGIWPEEALIIKNNAGLTEEYKYLKN